MRAPARLAGRLLEVDNLEDLVRATGDEDIDPVGEARLAYTDIEPVPFGDPIPVESVADGDVRLRAIAARADPDEWSEASVDAPSTERYGHFENGELLAVAAIHEWRDTLAHLSVFTDATARDRGLAGQVAAVAVASSLARGLIPQWRSRLGNDASARVADRLGFVPLGRQAFVRLGRM